MVLHYFLLVLFAVLVQVSMATPVAINQTRIIDPQNAERNYWNGIAAFITDSNLATLAQQLTENCTFGQNVDTTALATSYAQMNGQTYTGAVAQTIGVNLASATGQPVTPNWVNNRKDWTCSTNTCASGVNCGGYTQCVWINSLKMGCAVSNCPATSSSAAWQYLICLYNPAGNFNNQHPFGTDLSRCNPTPSSPTTTTPTTNPTPSSTPTTNPTPSSTPTMNPTAPTSTTPTTNPTPSSTPTTNPTAPTSTTPTMNPTSPTSTTPTTNPTAPNSNPTNPASPTSTTPTNNPTAPNNNPTNPTSTNPSMNPSTSTPSTNTPSSTPGDNTPGTTPGTTPGDNTPGTTPGTTPGSSSPGNGIIGDINSPVPGTNLPLWAIILIAVVVLIVIIVIIVVVVVVASKGGMETV